VSYGLYQIVTWSITSCDPRRCCEAVLSAILATAWLLVMFSLFTQERLIQKLVTQCCARLSSACLWTVAKVLWLNENCLKKQMGNGLWGIEWSVGQVTYDTTMTSLYKCILSTLYRVVIAITPMRIGFGVRHKSRSLRRWSSQPINLTDTDELNSTGKYAN